MEARLWDLEKSPQTPSLASRLLIFLAATHLERDSSTLCELSYLLLFILLQGAERRASDAFAQGPNSGNSTHLAASYK